MISVTHITQPALDVLHITLTFSSISTARYTYLQVSVDNVVLVKVSQS